MEPEINKGHYAKKTLMLIDAVKQQAAKHSDQMMFVATPEGIELAHGEHKLAALMGIEGGHSIEDSLALLRQYLRAGRALHDADVVQLDRIGPIAPGTSTTPTFRIPKRA